MESDTALPTGAQSAAAGEQSINDAAAAQPNEQQATGQEQPQGTENGAEGEGDKGKKEKTAEQREIDRLRRRVDNTTRKKYELEAELAQFRSQQRPQQQQQQEKPNQPAGDEDTVTLSRAELQTFLKEQAAQQAETERRQKVVQSLAKTWGKEEFDAKASDLEAALGGLTDRSGKPTPATDAIFDAENPKALIEYLTDPDNADEAERIASLPAVRVGREIARIEAKLEAKAREAKPQKSNAARPIESVKGGGVPTGMPDPADTKAYMKWANEQERAARR